MTGRTTTSVEPIRFDIESYTPDQCLVAAMADCVFVKPWEIAAIDVVQPGIFADLPGAY